MELNKKTDLENDVREGTLKFDSRDNSDDVETPAGLDEEFFTCREQIKENRAFNWR